MNQKTILKKSDKIRIFLNSPFVLILSILLSIGILMNMIHIFVLNNQLFIDLLGIIFPILFCIGIWTIVSIVFAYISLKHRKWVIEWWKNWFGQNIKNSDVQKLCWSPYSQLLWLQLLFLLKGSFLLGKNAI